MFPVARQPATGQAVFWAAFHQRTLLVEEPSSGRPSDRLNQ